MVGVVVVVVMLEGALSLHDVASILLYFKQAALQHNDHDHDPDHDPLLG